MAVVAIQVNDENITNDSIKNLVGAENYEYIASGHIKVFGQDAKEPQTVYYSENKLQITTPDFIKDMTYELIK